MAKEIKLTRSFEKGYFNFALQPKDVIEGSKVGINGATLPPAGNQSSLLLFLKDASKTNKCIFLKKGPTKKKLNKKDITKNLKQRF